MLGHHISRIGDMGTKGEGVWPQVIGAHKRSGYILGDHHRLDSAHAQDIARAQHPKGMLSAVLAKLGHWMVAGIGTDVQVFGHDLSI